mgnify:CR=1 FL=1
MRMISSYIRPGASPIHSTSGISPMSRWPCWSRRFRPDAFGWSSLLFRPWITIPPPSLTLVWLYAVWLLSYVEWWEHPTSSPTIGEKQFRETFRFPLLCWMFICGKWDYQPGLFLSVDSFFLSWCCCYSRTLVALIPIDEYWRIWTLWRHVDELGKLQETREED